MNYFIKLKYFRILVIVFNEMKPVATTGYFKAFIYGALLRLKNSRRLSGLKK